MIYLKAEIEIRPGHVPQMLELLTKRIFPIMGGPGGWHMLGCFVQRTGRLNTIVDLWGLEDMGHFDRAYAIFREHPDYPAIRVELDSHVEKETLVFMDHQYGPIADLEK
ncbi:NIPSNAP family protein [Sphingomonas profundi]|uniref:NIPSNAP family protein n=1 Tax=Alterirhizorhabdus profundi TaxID=2681549 RepID=UPI0018D1E8B4|nr:NIPSNAP family protein [Sphingomonas profundi]